MSFSKNRSGVPFLKSDMPRVLMPGEPDTTAAAEKEVFGMVQKTLEKLFGMEIDNLGQLSHRLSLMSNQAHGFKKDSRFVKHSDIADIYNQFLKRAGQGEEYDDEDEIATA
jgi:hypothetical protein